MHLPYLVELDGTTPSCIYEENMYECYYCGIKESPLQSIIEHCKLSHGEETLKYGIRLKHRNTKISKDS
jgi:hypothetical protein